MSNREELYKLIGFVPAERMNHKDLPKEHIVRYQKETEEANQRILDYLIKLSDRMDAMEKRISDVAAREHQIVVNVPEQAAPTVEVNVPTQPAPTIEFSPTIKASPVENVTHVVHAPEKKAKRTGTMQKNKDGTFSFTVEEE